MAKEYLVVLFPRDRRVMINDVYMGRTNKKLELEGGKYDVTLGPPKNFTPAQHHIDLRDTSSLMPLVVAYEDDRQ